MSTRSRRWRKWLWRLLATVVVARVLLAIFLLPLVNVGAGFAGLSISWRSASLSLCGLSFRAEDLVVRIKDDLEPPLLEARELVFDASTWQLLHGRISIVDAAVDSARVHVQRRADGSLRLPGNATGTAVAATATAPPIAAAPTTPTRFSFALPFGVASARLHDLRVDYADATTSPPTALEVTLDLDATDLGRPDRPGTVRLRAQAPQWFDQLEVFAQANAVADHFEATWHAAVRGVRTDDPQLPAAVRDRLHNFRLLAVELHGNALGDVLAALPTRPALSGDLTASVELDGREHLHLTATAGPPTMTAGKLDQPFALTLDGVDLVKSLRIDDGVLHVDDHESTATATLAIEALTARRLRPLLTQLGIRLPAAGIDLHAALHASLGKATSLRLEQLVIDADGTTTTLPRFEIDNLRQDGDTLAIGGIDIEGPQLTVHHTADGAIVFAGIRLTPPPALSSPATAPPTTAEPFVLPKLRLAHFAWHGASGTFVDEALPAMAPLTLENVEVTTDGLTLGEDAAPAAFRVRASLPEVLRSLQLDGTLTPRRHSLAVELHANLDGLTAQRLAPMLAAQGITPVLRDGKLELTTTATVAYGDGGVSGDFALSNLRLSDAGEECLRLHNVTGTGLRFGPHAIALGTWTVDDPFLAVQRTADLAWQLGGLQFAPVPAAKATATATTGKASVSPANAPGSAEPDQDSPSTISGSLTIRDGGVQFRDQTDQSPMLLGFAAQATLGTPTTPSTFDATLRLDGAIDSCHLRGDYLGSRQPQIEGSLDISGVRGAELARLLPSGIACDLEQGGLRAQVSLQTESGIALRVHELALTDRGAELAAVDEFVLQLAIANAEQVHVTNLNATGVRAVVTQTANGLRIPGFLLTPQPPPPPPQPAATDQPAAGATPTAGTATAVAPPPPIRLPVLSIDALSLDLERLVVRQRLATDGEPLVLAAKLSLLEPWHPKADGDHPLAAHLQFAGSASPLCAGLQADIHADPYELTPSLDLVAKATGIDTTAVTRIWPSLAERLQGRTTAAELTAHLQARLDLKRRDARAFDFAKPFGGEFTLEDFALRDTTTDTTIAAVEAIDAVARAIDPKTGDVLLRSLDIDAPNLSVTNTAAGLELFGICIPNPPPATTASTTSNSSTAPATTVAPVAPVAPAGPGSEFAVDRLDLQGMSVAFRDDTTTPTTNLPMAQCDLQLRNFSTRAFTEPLPFRFHLSLQGAAIPMAQRVVASSVLAGMLGSAAKAVTGQANRDEMEKRPWLDSLQVTGDLTLSPYVKGDVAASLVGLELPALRGIASTGGVKIDDGTYDLSLSLGLRGLDGVDIDSQSVFTWLSITEPPDGPISTYLRLPAPLNTVLFLLKNDADEQRLQFRMHAGGKGDGTSVTDRIVEAIAHKIADAVASAGSRAIGTVTGLIGFGGAGPLPTAEQDFAAGDPLPTSGDLTDVVQALAKDPTLRATISHELGAGDLERAASLATPSAAVVRQSLDRLRAERRDLQAQRQPLAEQVAALYATGQMWDARHAQAQLAAVDQRLGDLERTLDEGLGMVGGDSPRAAGRRTRNAALALANARLEALRDELLRRVPGLTADRIELRQPRSAITQGLDAGGRLVVATRRSTR